MKKKQDNLTVNQLLDKFESMKVDDVTEELGEIRQHLIDVKKSGGAKGGLTKVMNSDAILLKIKEASQHELQR